MVIILFNIIEPAGWKVGLTRIEDMAIGCGVSIVVGLPVLAPGAMAALGRALSTAFAASSGYLAEAVDRLTIDRRHVDTDASQQASTAPTCCSTTPSPVLHRAGEPRSFQSRRFYASLPDQTGFGSLPSGAPASRCPVRPPAAGQPEVDPFAVAEAVLRDSFAHRATAGTRSSPTFWPIAGPCSFRAAAHQLEVLHDVLRKAFEAFRAQAAVRPGADDPADVMGG